MTSYEAKAFVAITTAGSGTATDLHAPSGIPRPAVDGVHTQHHETGTIDIKKANPMTYTRVSTYTAST